MRLLTNNTYVLHWQQTAVDDKMISKNKYIGAAIVAALSIGYGHGTSPDDPLREGIPPKAVSPVASELDRQNEPAAGTTAITINPESPLEQKTSMSNMRPLALELHNLRDQEVKGWASNLMRSQFGWFRAGNAAEALSQVCQALTVVLSGCAAGFKERQTELALASMCTGTISMALGKFSKYAHGESSDRGVAANEFLKSANVPPIPIIKDPSVNPSGTN